MIAKMMPAILALLVMGCSTTDITTANAFTAADLIGSYDLDSDATTLAEGYDGGGLNMISETVEIRTDTLTFAPTFVRQGTFSLAGDTLTITGADESKDVVQARFSDAGNTLTLTDEIGDHTETFVFSRRGETGGSDQVNATSLQGHYDLNTVRTKVTNFPLLAAGELKIAGNKLTTWLTFSQTRHYAINGDIIILTESDGSTTHLRATLSQDRNTLTLKFIEDRETFVYKRR